MPTKKASKKSGKKSGKKIAKKKAGTKSSTKKSGAKKATLSGKGSKKGVGGGAAKAKKGAAKAKESVEAAEDVLVGNCIGLGTAGTFVERAVIAVGGISPGDFDIDKKFEAMGVISANQCALVRQRVLNDVRAFPCTINDGAVTCDPGDKARAMRDAVQANAGRP